MNKTSAIYFLLAIACAALLIFLPSGCGTEGNGSPRITKKDTSVTLAAFLGYQLKTKHYGPARRISWDSLIMKWNKDSTDADPLWEKFTYYEAEVPVIVDSALNVNLGYPLLDSTGKPNVVRLLMGIPPQYVRDTIYDLDSAYRYLDRFLVKDSINK